MSTAIAGHPQVETATTWRLTLVALVVAWAWILWWFRETAWGMVGIWARSETYTHGFVVLPIVLWLTWRRRALLATLAPRPSPWVLLPMAGAAVFWLLGDLVAVNAATQAALVALLVLCVPLLAGWGVTSQLLFPLAFLFFAVPFGDFLMPRLMEWTADFTVVALRGSGIPVYREGLQFVIPSGNWSVVEACSGIRYLIASFMVGCLFAYVSYRSTVRRITFVAVSLLVPIAANWLRAYIIVMLGHLSGNKIAAGVDHIIYGWVFFGIVIFAMFLIGARWSEPDEAGVAPRQDAPAAQPLPGTRLRLGWSVALLLALAVGPQAAYRILDRYPGAATVALQDLAPAAGWAPAPSRLMDWTPAFDNPSASRRWEFVRQDASVGVYISYYRHQGYERKLVSSGNALVRSKDLQWAQVSAGSALANGARWRTAELRSLASSGGSDRWTVWQCYWVDGKLACSDAWAKLHGAWGRLRGEGDDGAVIFLYAPVAGAEAALGSFLGSHLDGIEKMLAQTRSSSLQGEFSGTNETVN